MNGQIRGCAANRLEAGKVTGRVKSPILRDLAHFLDQGMIEIFKKNLFANLAPLAHAAHQTLHIHRIHDLGLAVARAQPRRLQNVLANRDWPVPSCWKGKPSVCLGISCLGNFFF